MSIVNNTYGLLSESLAGHQPILRRVKNFYSDSLDRKVQFDVYLPAAYHFFLQKRYPLLIFNDGQDLPVMHLSDRLADLYRKKAIRPVIAVGIHANRDRMREYGVVSRPDYRGRGDRAPQYARFIFSELLPYLNGTFRLSGVTAETAIAGFSLGGLSALDIAWANPGIFGITGVFSGSLWWRWEPVQGRADPDAARIMHHIIRSSAGTNPGQRYWFETGTQDETEDRNNNNVIDAIDDTIDLIRELKLKGVPDADIRYLEIQGGQHNPQTWGLAVSDFLLWAYPR